MSIYRLFDVELLGKYIEDGWINVQTHPTLPLNILSYSRNTQYKRFWNDITRHCRGLVVERDTGRIVGNCLLKFFNHDEIKVDTDGPVQVTDKLDGSYLSAFLYNDEIVVATRGSFTSPQAQEAMKIINENVHYQTALKILCRENTAIFEIVYPANRIVLDYGNVRDLILIGTIANFELSAGRQLWTPATNIAWPGLKVETFKVDSYTEALSLPPRENAEGIVIYFENTGERVKVKQEDYKELHRIMTNCTARRIWMHLAVEEFQHVIKTDNLWATYLQIKPAEVKEIQSTGSNWEATFLNNVPDEFDQWVTKTVQGIRAKIAYREYDIRQEYIRIWNKVGKDRKAFALETLGHPDRDLMFYLLDNKDRDLKFALWLAAKPEHETPFLTTDES